MTTTTCTWIERDDVFEGYVRDALGAEERDAFEEHYFTCEACFDKLKTYQALQVELGALSAEAPAAEVLRGWSWRWALVPVAAGLVLVAGVALWMRGSAPTVPESTVAVAPAPQAPAVPAPSQTPSAVEPQPATVVPQAGRSGPTAAPTKPPASAPVVALSVLARVEPPLYIPLSLRGPRDAATERFETAMRRYVDGDYAGAIPDLSAAAALSPNSAHITFFLAICNLLTDRPDAAIDGLQKTIALGESPYLEEGHFYLAKARLGQGDVSAARRELVQTIERQGRLQADARRLLAQVDALARGR